MKLYRKKPIVIEAKEFNRKDIESVKHFTKGKLKDIDIPRCLDGIMTAKIDTLEGVLTVTEGDFIIKGVEGEFYPCKPNIFNKTYEEVIVLDNLSTRTIESDKIVAGEMYGERIDKLPRQITIDEYMGRNKSEV